MIAPTKESPYPIGGAYLTALADPNHFMTAGVRSQLNVMYVGNDIYRPIKQSAGSNVVRFADTKTVLRSGHIWDDTKQQLAFKPFLIEQRVGSGRVIAFTQNPNFRAQQMARRLFIHRRSETEPISMFSKQQSIAMQPSFFWKAHLASTHQPGNPTMA